jgi:tRNA (guanosine-2'-O-)-methyltransferase
MANPELIQYLENFVTERRKELFYNNIQHRTRYITVVLEDIFQSQNASAVLRTCDCLGIQDVHVIENYNKYQINPDVALGSNKWITLKKYNLKQIDNTDDAIKNLKAAGYRIVATSPHKNDIDLTDFKLENGKAAFLFGNEKQGLSKNALNLADEYVKIPMFGFTESYNISVSAAILLYQLIIQLKISKDIDWRVSDDEKNDILLQWFRISIRNSKGIISKFYTRNTEAQ